MSGRCVQLKEVGKIARGQIIDNFETEKREFVLNAFFNRKPVEGMKEWTHMSRSGGSEYQSGSVVLNFLELRQKMFGTTGKKGVTVIQSRQNK